MDCASTGTTAGIDPKAINNWQPDSAFSVNSYNRRGYNQHSEWDSSQESSPRDGTVMGQGPFERPLDLDVSLFNDASDFLSVDNSQVTSPNLNLGDGHAEGTVSGPLSPRTLSSSADEKFHSDESLPPFHLLNTTTGMPMEAPLYQYPKAPTAPTGTVIVDENGNMPNGQEYSDIQSDQLMPYQNMFQVFPFVQDSWTEGTINPTPESLSPADNPVPLAMEQQLGTGEAQGFANYQNSMRALELRWLNGLSPNMVPNDSFSTIPHDLGYQDRNQNGKDDFHYKSESSSASGDIPGLCVGHSDDALAFTEGNLDDENARYVKWEDASDGDAQAQLSQPLTSTSAFMTHDRPSEFTFDAVPPRSKASFPSSQRTTPRPSPLSLQSMATIKKRKQRGTSISLVENNQKPLQIVQEDGQGGSFASADFISPPRGARRKGPLSLAGRANAGMRRKNKDTCVQCRLNKRKCDGNSPCDACRPTLHEQPCARACFANIVEYGTCNYISQRAINHPTRDGSGRVRMDIPSEFNLNDLLSYLNERQGRFNIRARQSWGSLYVLDLGEAYRFMKSLSEYNGNSRSTFLEFIDRRLVESKDRSKNWLTCVKDCDPMNNVYALLSQWNNMPSRASYSFVSLQGGEERPMDVNNPEDRRDILLAAQLSRIVCRMLEVEGFRKLERDFYNIKWKQISNETHIRFLGELGRILLSLRWRVSWWKLHGDGSHESDPSQQHYVDRVDLICRILYVYYTNVLAKLPSWSTTDVPKGVWSHYADSENPIWDDFPSDPTDGGFHAWMDRGRELIQQAVVHSRGKNL
ncbi:hypothetical protein PHISCL_02671 [Aspergillus sclerotialis]|uniref:Zn(2)-C6 fungal-type domain-containing protein n=1 Tax=Aspergillus sclerotialis TaxID=2070753 RepID=A0A3A2ZQN3_9EURO|nr:hypothetical protein PHISCL_02671 [Aspergillus sclerotialis]